MKLERIADALVFVVVILFLAFMAGAFRPLELEEAGPPAPAVTSGLTPTQPGAVAQFETVWSSAISATAPNPTPAPAAPIIFAIFAKPNPDSA